MTGEFAVAVHALVYLHHKDVSLSSEALAENVCTNPARVRKVMAKLRRAGLVETKEGPDGGYLFRRDPQRVTLRQVCDAVGAVLVSASWRPGGADMDCLVASGMADVLDGLYTRLDEECRRSLETVTVQDICDELFRRPRRRKLE